MSLPAIALSLALSAAVTGQLEEPPPTEVPAPPRLLLVSLVSNGVPAEVARSFDGAITVEVARAGALEVISQEELRRIVEVSAQQQLLGCIEERCLADMAKLASAGLVLFGDVALVGAEPAIRLTLFDASAGRVVQRVDVRALSLDVMETPLVDGLVELLTPVLPAEDVDAWKQDIDRRREERLRARLQAPEGPPLYVVDPKMVGLPEDVGRAVSSRIASVAQEDGLAVFTTDDARVVLARSAEVALLGSDAEGPSLAALGKTLGVPHVIATVVTSLGGDVIVQARLIDVARVAVISRREAKASDVGGSLLEAVDRATRLVLAPIFAHLKGRLALTVSEEGANVLVNEVQVGVTPLDDELTLPGGHHLVTVTKDGFIRHQETVRVAAGKTILRDVLLRPSLEYLEEYRTRSGLYRTLAWSSSAVTIPLVVGAAGFGAAWVWQNEESGRVRSTWEQRIEDEKIGEFDDRFAQAQSEIKDSENLAGLYGALAPIVGAVTIAAGATAAWFWIFGDDPDRYADLEAEPLLTP